jgi:RimJ/RimL family protein N-acetyltransferase
LDSVAYAFSHQRQFPPAPQEIDGGKESTVHTRPVKVTLIIRLEENQYERARPLFQNLHYQLAVESMLDGTNPGWIYVDDEEDPCCAWMVNSEGFYLAGDPSNKEFNAWMEKWFENYVRHGNQDWESETVLLFDISSDDWVSSFPDIFSLRPPLEVNRMHYICTDVAVDWRALLPRGFSVHRIDEHILDNDALEIPDHLGFWVKMNWGTPAYFLEHGFGTCVVHENAIVSYSLADCVHGDECEIGIQTLEAYRRRGLATVTPAANVELAFKKGFRQVGWHTHDYNKASQRTAEKVGFELERRYIQYECHRFEAMHIAETGLRFYFKGKHQMAAETLEKAIKTGDVDAWVYSLAARVHATLDNTDRALELLRLAVDMGWANTQAIQHADFDSLRACPEWEVLVGQVEMNAAKES